MVVVPATSQDADAEAEARTVIRTPFELESCGGGGCSHGLGAYSVGPAVRSKSTKPSLVQACVTEHISSSTGPQPSEPRRNVVNLVQFVHDTASCARGREKKGSKEECQLVCEDQGTLCRTVLAAMPHVRPLDAELWFEQILKCTQAFQNEPLRMNAVSSADRRATFSRLRDTWRALADARRDPGQTTLFFQRKGVLLLRVAICLIIFPSSSSRSLKTSGKVLAPS